MTQEAIIKAISDDKMMPFIQLEQLAQIVAFVIENYRPSLPFNLDEAANRQTALEQPYKWEEEQDGSFGVTPLFVMSNIRSTFKAGAEWMAGQGVTIEDGVCELYDKLYLYYIDDCSSVTPDISCEMLKELGASKGDKVVVQIRKK